MYLSLFVSLRWSGMRLTQTKRGNQPTDYVKATLKLDVQNSTYILNFSLNAKHPKYYQKHNKKMEVEKFSNFFNLC